MNDLNRFAIFAIKMVGVMECIEHLANNVKTEIDGQWSATAVAIVEPRGERVAVDVLEHHDVSAIFDSEIDDVDHSWVLHLREDLGLANEQSVAFVSRLDVRTHALDDHRSSESLCAFQASEMNCAHPALA